jgi:YkoY family integral membrane protein
MDSILEFLREWLGQDLKAAGLVIINLILIESLLSVDNAAVLATMVMDLPKEQRAKALKYGILGAYVFRFICLLLASFIMQVSWLKALGGFYLAWLCFDFFKGKRTPKREDDLLDKKYNWLYRKTIGRLGNFWSTVLLVEMMDLAFSLDNVLAAMSFTENMDITPRQMLTLVCIGVFIGILAMRFVAQGFIKLMERFIFLDAVAFIVIGILGLKLIVSFICEKFDNEFCIVINGHNADLYLSMGTVGLFVLSILLSLLFRRKSPPHQQKN